MRSPLLAWLLVVALAAVIFLLSAQPDLAVAEGDTDLVLRKLGHMAAFGLLAVLAQRAFALSGVHRPALPAAALALAYAVSDEWHQTFVEGRHGSPIDVGIDAIGIGVALALARRPALARRLA